MNPTHESLNQAVQPHCCPCSDHGQGLTRRSFIGDTGAAFAMAGVALAATNWSRLAAAQPGIPMAPARKPLVVKPILVHTIYQRRPQTSWRSWGGIQTQQDADEEVGRIQKELNEIRAKADFPVEFLPVSAIQNAGGLNAMQADLGKADALLVYASGGDTSDYNKIAELKKDTVVFLRHKSGPLSLWYEIVAPRFLRQHTDEHVALGVDFKDVVVDSSEEIEWRLRSLCGLKNTRGSRILAVGGPDGWAQPRGVVPALVKERWNLDIRTIEYKQLGELIQQARADQAAVKKARERAAQYLNLPGTQLETDKPFVENAMLLDQIFRSMMAENDCKALTINGCMGTIMPLAETSACLTLSTLNDDGYLAFCESDFVVIPSGILLAGISGLPTFLNDPTYPHDGVITLAHCTAPRKMDGKQAEPVRLLTHFESDYGAAPKVDMRIGQTVTNIVPDFKAERWVGLLGVIKENPFLPICRSQIDIEFQCDSDCLAERMPGFHWMTGYGDYMQEIGYALKKVGIQWDTLA